IDPGGTRILAHEQRGVRSLLHCFDVERGQCTPLQVPPGTLHGNPVWTTDGILVPWSTPQVPLTLLEYGPDAERRPAITLPPSQSNPTHPGVEAVIVPGAEGPIEAIAYGGPDWIRLPKLVVALHGGPLEAWRFAYDPLFDQL